MYANPCGLFLFADTNRLTAPAPSLPPRSHLSGAGLLVEWEFALAANGQGDGLRHALTSAYCQKGNKQTEKKIANRNATQVKQKSARAPIEYSIPT